MSNLDFEKIMVVNFAVEERTIALSNYCFKRLGFKNIINIQGEDGFRDKFLKFAKIASESNCECFVRSDADRLVFEGMLRLVETFYKNPSAMCAEGLCFDYFMNCYRGATPHVFSKEILTMLHEDNELMPNSQKPESHFVAKVAPGGTEKFLSSRELTNLHEYDQYPSKVCNAYLNRIYRGHQGYYDKGHLERMPDYYKRALNEARRYASNNESKNTMNHIDFSFLDLGFPILSEEKIEELYNYYSNLYRELKVNLENNGG